MEKVAGTCPYHKDCFEEFKPIEKEKPTISKTDIRKPVDKVAGTCPYHKDCFEECKSTKAEKPKHPKLK